MTNIYFKQVKSILASEIRKLVVSILDKIIRPFTIVRFLDLIIFTLLKVDKFGFKLVLSSLALIVIRADISAVSVVFNIEMSGVAILLKL